VPSDRALIERYFAQADEAARRSRMLVDRQREIIAALERDGHDASRARELLRTFEQTQADHEYHVVRLRADLRGSD
jgi:hypothetical protein